MVTMRSYRIKTVTEYHRVLSLPKPQHPLISVIDVASFSPPKIDEPVYLIFDFYCISLKRGLNVRIKYGQQYCDFDEGVLFCMSPGQVWSMEPAMETDSPPSGWMIIIHPDFLWNTMLAKTIKGYEYFSYSVREALFLSDKEESMLTGIVKNIEQEYHGNVDKFSRPVIIAQLELMLTYANRFYQRQFITRNTTGNEIVSRVEDFLSAYFTGDMLVNNGLPAVGDIAAHLNMSPGYLSELLKALTGQNTQQHIHDKLIEKAKERLSTTNLPIREIAYELGFEHAQSFNKLFKAKTKLTPGAFRAL